MIYLKVAHVDDNDADYFRFYDLIRAAKYIADNKEQEWVMTDERFEEMPLEGDYTFVDVQL